MGLHVLAAAGIVCPLVLKLLMSFRVFDGALYQLRLFLSGLGHMAFNREIPLSSLARLELALRSIRETLAQCLHLSTSSLSSPENGLDTFHAFSMFAF